MDRKDVIKLSPQDYKEVGYVLRGLGLEVVRRDPTLLERFSSWMDHTRGQLNVRRAIVFRLH
ncbi:hypothetical protein HYW44_01850 [Candidatus Daviesbacteria bacterium]|nr:hypothetical protein [Candidatus Daviesbacteria bacterium]